MPDSQCSQVDEIMKKNDRSKIDEQISISFTPSAGSSSISGVCANYKYFNVEKTLEKGRIGRDSFYFVKVPKKVGCSVVLLGKQEPQGDMDQTVSSLTSKINWVSQLLMEATKIQMSSQDSVIYFSSKGALEEWCNSLTAK